MRNKLINIMKCLALIACSLLLASCYTARPSNVQNICNIFRQYPQWYWDTLKVQKKWGVSPPVVMSIMYQESGFVANARPPRRRLLWVIPWTRPSSAYGYAQALDGTWDIYEKQTRSSGSRDAFDDSADFIGWYVNYMNKKIGLAKNSAYEIYLAYHEGTGNYVNKTYLKKPWLLNVAKRVQYRASLYQQQLTTCEASLPKKSWWRLW